MLIFDQIFGYPLTYTFLPFSSDVFSTINVHVSLTICILNPTDDKILAQLVHEPAIKDPEQQEQFRAGLRNLISSLRERSIKDFNTLAKEIIAYRQDFLGDKSKILNL